jgi:hypothetical protein
LFDKADIVTFCKTQYGSYGYNVTIANKTLRNLVFDKLERELFSILSKSSKNVRFMFYAGLLEADGSIDNTVCWSFGISLKRENFNRNFCIEKLKEATRLNFLLKKDGFDPILSRKVSKSTIKYDVRILRNNSRLAPELANFQELANMITHPYKVKLANQLIEKVKIGGNI